MYLGHHGVEPHVDIAGPLQLPQQVDEQGGKVFCLVEAPDAEVAVRVYPKPTGWSPTTSTQWRTAPRQQLLANPVCGFQ
jgi:hypothetical protein